MAGRVGFNGHRCATAADVINRKFTLSAICAVVDGDLPIGAWEGSSARRVVKFDAQVIFFQPDGVEAEAFAVDAVKPDTGGAIDNQIVVDDLIGKCRP